MDSPGVRHMGMGLLWFVGGVGFTLLTYAAAKPSGVYLVARGAMFFGMLQFLYGIAVYVLGKISMAHSSLRYRKSVPQNTFAAKAVSKKIVEVPNQAIKINASQPAPQISRWEALIKYDSDVAAAAERLRPHGERWIEELGRAFLALDEDKKYLDNIVKKILVDAADERRRQWVDQFRMTCSGELCTEASLEVLQRAEISGYVLNVESNGTIAATRGEGTSYLYSNSDIQRFGKYLR